MKEKVNISSLRQQYSEIKKDCHDSILLFQFTRFFIIFDDDAKDASKIFGKPVYSLDDGIPVISVLVSDVMKYINELVGASKKVAIYRPVGFAHPITGEFDRKVLLIVSPENPRGLPTNQTPHLMGYPVDANINRLAQRLKELSSINRN